MTVAGTAMTLPRRRGVRGMHALPGGWQEAWGRCPCAWAGISTQTPPPRQGRNSQGGWQAAPQRPDALVACDLHKSILGKVEHQGQGLKGGDGQAAPQQTPRPPLWDREAPAHPPCAHSPYQCAREVGGGLVPGGAAVAILADIQMVHEPIAVEETLPWGGRQQHHH